MQSSVANSNPRVDPSDYASILRVLAPTQQANQYTTFDCDSWDLEQSPARGIIDPGGSCQRPGDPEGLGYLVIQGLWLNQYLIKAIISASQLPLLQGKPPVSHVLCPY